MIRKRLSTGSTMCLALAAGVLLLAAPALAQGPAGNDWQDPRDGVPRGDGTHLGTGTVQYDPGAPADALVSGTNFTNNYFGNLFDTRNGAPLSPGAVTQISWYQGPVGDANVALPVFGPAVGPPSQYLFVNSPAAYAFNSVAVSWSAPSPFFAGVAEVTQQTCCINIGSGGVRSASTNGQGFHGQQRGFSGSSTNVLTGQNFMARVSGTIIVPVELMEFAVE